MDVLVLDNAQHYQVHKKKFYTNFGISLGKESLCSSGMLNNANEGYLTTSGRVFLNLRKYTPLFEHLEEKRHGFKAVFTLKQTPYFLYQQLA